MRRRRSVVFTGLFRRSGNVRRGRNVRFGPDPLARLEFLHIAYAGARQVLPRPSRSGGAGSWMAR